MPLSPNVLEGLALIGINKPYQQKYFGWVRERNRTKIELEVRIKDFIIYYYVKQLGKY